MECAPWIANDSKIPVETERTTICISWRLPEHDIGLLLFIDRHNDIFLTEDINPRGPFAYALVTLFLPMINQLN